MRDLDPIYEYIKGKGWVAQSNLVTMDCGTEVRYEIRKPRPLSEERYLRLEKSNHPEIDISILSMFRFWSLSCARGDSYEIMARDYHLIVVTPVHTVSEE